jgi:hypothetical protein
LNRPIQSLNVPIFATFPGIANLSDYRGHPRHEGNRNLFPPSARAVPGVNQTKSPNPSQATLLITSL